MMSFAFVIIVFLDYYLYCEEWLLFLRFMNYVRLSISAPYFHLSRHVSHPFDPD